MKKYIVYYRVSTKQQGSSGLGLDAQKTYVAQFLKANDAKELPPSYTEIESGKNSNRPELRKAIDKCKQEGATLLIAKLDRLSRDIAFIFTLKSELQSAGVDFVACDLPEANTITLGVMAAFAQHERERISERTRAGLAEAKRRGKKLGNPQNLTDDARKKAAESISRNARESKEARHAYHFIKPLRDQGISYAKIAQRLNKEGYITRTGKRFHPIQVQWLVNRFAEIL